MGSCFISPAGISKSKGLNMEIIELPTEQTELFSPSIQSVKALLKVRIYLRGIFWVSQTVT